jgi:hypothetical protein
MFRVLFFPRISYSLFLRYFTHKSYVLTDTLYAAAMKIIIMHFIMGILRAVRQPITTANSK